MRVYSPLRRLVPMGKRRGWQGLRIVDFSGGGARIYADGVVDASHVWDDGAERLS